MVAERMRARHSTSPSRSWPPTPKHSTASEERRWLIGESDFGVVVVVFTVRQPDKINRIITARRAGRKERSRYDEAKNLPL